MSNQPQLKNFGESVLGEQIPRWGNGMSRGIGRFVLRLTGWKLEGDIPNLSKFVIIGAPHTSNWDFLLAISAIFALGVRIYWLGKHTFVNGFGSSLWRWLGGIAVNRAAAHGAVKQVVHEFKTRQHFVLGLAPEGTRKKVSQWKTGFYFIAQQADVPILPAALDYSRRVIQICPLLYPSGDVDNDLSILRSYYRSEMGKKPHQF